MQYVISNEAYVTKMEAYGREQAVVEEIIDLKAWIPTFFLFHHHLKKKTFPFSLFEDWTE